MGISVLQILMDFGAYSICRNSRGGFNYDDGEDADKSLELEGDLYIETINSHEK